MGAQASSKQPEVPPDHPVFLCVATLFAPLPILAPVFLAVLAMDNDVARAKAVIGMYAIVVGTAGVLLFAAGRPGRESSLEVGFAWIFAGAAAAAFYTVPA